MKKAFLFITVFLLLAGIVNADSWQGIIMHNGFYCYYLGSETEPTVLAAREQDWIHIKVKSPVDLGNTGTAWAKIGGLSAGGAYNYHNGWIYLSTVLSNVKFYGFKYITVYHDTGMREGGKTVTLNFQNLNLDTMYDNDHKAFDLYW